MPHFDSCALERASTRSSTAAGNKGRYSVAIYEMDLLDDARSFAVLLLPLLRPCPAP